MKATLGQTCFVVSPIGSDGSDSHKTFREILDYVIKPAVKQSGFDMRVVRADDIERPGSFIKDILDQLLDSYVVIADLTGQNPNVFYELGVRHALSPRTILIAQSMKDIPSDLREYRAIVYDASAKGAAQFAKRMKGFLAEISAAPHRSDNPVLDRLGSVLEKRTQALEAEVAQLRGQLESVLKKGSPKTERATTHNADTLSKRLGRLLGLYRAEAQYLGGEVTFKYEGKKRVVRLPTQQGPFRLHFLMAGEQQISAYWYVAVDQEGIDPIALLPDVRVLMQACSDGQGLPVTFVIVAEENLKKRRVEIERAFRETRKHVRSGSRSLFGFDLWDAVRLEELERSHGLRIDEGALVKKRTRAPKQGAV